MQAERSLTAHCQTWSRDSHGLFDYESHNLTEQQLVCRQSGSFVRVGEEVQFVQSGQTNAVEIKSGEC